MTKKKLYLFVWENFCRDYTPGLAFAIAHDEAEARKLVEEKVGSKVYVWDWGQLTVRRLDWKYANYVTGGG